jgi:SAM-dependent methyltransferase
MSAAANETVPQISTRVEGELGEPVLLSGIALASFSALLLELAMTRLFSVVLFYHFAFLAISIALLGLGAGGVFTHLWKGRLKAFSTRTIAAFASALSAVLIPVVLVIVLHVPVSLRLTGGNFLRLTAIYACTAVPFFLTGLLLSVVFARESHRISRMYGADLMGGALACLAVVPLLNWLGGPNAILFSAFVAACGAVIWSPSAFLKKISLGVSCAIVLLIALNAWRSFIDIVWAKGLRQENVEFSRWNAISRVEVDRNPDGSRMVVIDADASTYIMNADPAKWAGSGWQENLMTAPPAIVNVLRPHGDYAIIGPGGGPDVLRAVANGSRSVTGIEINPIIANTIMRQRYADFAYHLYERPGVDVHVGDGRSFIRNEERNFDVVQMTLVDTWASTAAGAFALSENNLYTVQAFKEYFDHLKPDGILSITRWEFSQPREALRVASVAIQALHELRIKDVANHFMVISQDELDEDGIHVGVLVKKNVFTEDEEAAVSQHLKSHPPLQLLYTPSQPSLSIPGAAPFANLIKSNDPAQFSRTYAYNVTPVTDDAPFFFFTMKPGHLIPGVGDRHAMDWKVNLGVAVLLMLLVISILAVLAFLIVPLLALEGTAKHAGSLLYFVAVGLGYILVEVTFIQRFVLFLGYPTYALTVVVFLMLLSSGAGSVVSGRWMAATQKIWLPLSAIVAAVLIHVGLLPRILERSVGAAFPEKLVISGLVLIPLGFLMGMPFPVGLKALSRTGSDENAIEWAWAMNAASSVLGSVLAIIIAILFGLNITLAVGAVAYLAAFLLRTRLPLGAHTA